MNYKETLFFVAKCLTISLEEKNKQEIENQLKTTIIDWDAVVKLSTGHFVFPALYCNLKRAEFLHYLPEELVNYMVYITDLNRERNAQIIEQAKEINEILSANNITPIFLKGTGNILEGLYEDIAERMVGDIDFIVSKNDYLKTIELITKAKYKKVFNKKYISPLARHYFRLHKENTIAAVEIHQELIIEKFAKEFDYEVIFRDIQIINNISVLSFNHQLALSIMAKQINDDGMYYKNIILRNAYDVYLLSKKTDAKSSIIKFNKLFEPLNSFLAICFETFNNVSSLSYTKTKQTKKFLSFYIKLINNKKYAIKHGKRVNNKLYLKTRFELIYQSLFQKKYRIWLLDRILKGRFKPKPNA